MKRTKYILLAGLLILGMYAFFQLNHNSLNCKEMSSSNPETENSTYQIIETNFFVLKIPEKWNHIFNGYGNEGDPFGTFQTYEGLIHYEYGNFAPKYINDDELKKYVVEKKKINGLQVNISKNKKSETGIYIPKQSKMKTSLTFYMDQSVTNNFADLMKVIKNIQFK
ncbi:hypothetical protein [uncultured Polaribacter sp.]|uniref:hypothetical protein n=1 Tax=uncultured Polaribacter sp. TaxID=174711 RepID=UPI002616B64E|nr:hypothetical protein [uncultured Polaribacter sp.]